MRVSFVQRFGSLVVVDEDGKRAIWNMGLASTSES